LLHPFVLNRNHTTNISCMNISLHPANPNRIVPAVFLFVVCFLAKPAFCQTTPATITRAIEPAYDSVSSFHRFWLGEGYRKIWAAPVELKVLQLDKERGGLKPVGMGGGFQTKSLRLQDANGKQWVLRSVQKYPERRLPQFLRNTVAQRILQDQVVTVHPFASLTVPPLADALQIVHTNPQMVYVADDPALGQYRSNFSNAVFIFEERGAIDTFRTINTEAVQRELEEGGNKRINQRLVLRARLLDLLLGDWDRHEGQWRWEAKRERGDTVFHPVPHDRDYVFYTTSGVLPWLVSQQNMNARFQKFGDHVRDIETYNFNNRYFDRYFLNALAEDDWKEEIEFVQKNLTDDVIQRAIKRMPDTIYALSGKHIVETLISRRNHLKEDAMQYYRFLSADVDVPATAGSEMLSVQHQPDGKIVVTVSSAASGAGKGNVLYRREFDPAVTKEVRLYGLGGDDRFAVSGSATTSIRLRMIGGDGKDHFDVAEENPNKRRLIIYDRSDEANSYSHRARVRTGTDTVINSYDRRNFRYNVSNPFFSLGYNIDQRTYTSFGWTWQKNGFRKDPYASRYEADWRRVFGKAGLNLRIVSLGPGNVQNFFGTGNETVFPPNSKNGRNILFYRNRYDLSHADLRIKWPMARHVAWSIGLAAQYYASAPEDNKTRFLGVYDKNNPGEQVFLNRFHGGVGAGVEVDTRSNVFLPTGGVVFNTDVRAMTQLRGEKRSFTAIQSDFSLYTRLSRDSGVVLMNRVGGGTTFGEPVFYQMMQLGGQRSLRGFNTARFTGRSALFHSAELRLKLFQFTSYLFPGTFGLIGFHDVGRVWMPGESSTKWHNGYGGGVYLVPANALLLRATVGHSEETTQFYFNLVFGL
jgi:hypothetical protein